MASRMACTSWAAGLQTFASLRAAAVQQLPATLPAAVRMLHRSRSTAAAVAGMRNSSAGPNAGAPFVPSAPEDSVPYAEEGTATNGLPQQFAHPLIQYRATYPETVWAKIVSHTRETAAATAAPAVAHVRNGGGALQLMAVDIGVGTGRGAVELARRGCKVVGVEATPQLLAQTQANAAAQGVALALVSARMEQRLLPSGAADLVSIMHGLHLVDTHAALGEAHRLLRPGGTLVAAWNDRDLSSPFNCQLEDLLEQYNPEYNRYTKQRDLEQWGDLLQGGQLFKLAEFSVHSHSLHLKSGASLLDFIGVCSAVRHCRRSSVDRRALHRAVLDVVHAHFGPGPFELPLETKLYLLHRNDVAGLRYDGDGDSNAHTNNSSKLRPPSVRGSCRHG